MSKKVPEATKVTRKLTLSKTTTKKLTTKSGIKAGRCTVLRTGCIAHTC